jgi:hypothetical protein
VLTINNLLKLKRGKNGPHIIWKIDMTTLQ